MQSEIATDKPVYPIRIAAKLLNISVHTLRMYEKENLILPYKKSTNHRLYSQYDLDRIQCIRNAINEMKISINGIKSIYSLMPCWEIMKCSNGERSKCNAYLTHNKPCWASKSDDTICAPKECRECTVYKNYGECGSIKNFIRTKLTSIQ
jgi:MerR family transcriptional regulator, heat shock protein HspR